MPRVIMLIPNEPKVGLTSVKLGIIHAMKRVGIYLSIFKPISQQISANNTKNENNVSVCNNHVLFTTTDNSLEMDYVESLLLKNQMDVLLEEIINNYHRVITKDTKVILVEGLSLNNKYQFIQQLNYEIAKALNAEIIFILSQNTDTLEQLKKRIELICINFNNTKKTNITGVIINKLNAPINKYEHIISNFPKIFTSSVKEIKIDPNILLQNFCKILPVPILGVIPWNRNLVATRAIDIANYLNASIINRGDIDTNYLTSIVFCTQSVQHLLKYFSTGSLLVISANRYDVLIAACLAVMNGIKIGAILLIDDYKPNFYVNKLCKDAFATGLPVFLVNTSIWQTFTNLYNFNFEIPVNDGEYISKIQEYVEKHIDIEWIKSLSFTTPKKNCTISPALFCYKLTELARKANKYIILPESDESRILKAANICAEKNIATCILLGNPNKIKYIANLQDIKLNTKIEIIDPDMIRENYITRLIELRKNKGMTETIAHEQLKDNVILGTLMLEKGEVDGLVSGAINTTANTIRPSLQLIKTASNSSLVSSIFFMLLPEQVYIYGDCAINLDPTAEQLAEIAIRSADSAIAFDIEPRVAMLSYSTGTSGSGSDVEKVREATLLAQKKRPDLIIDGPLQYDAAVVTDIAKFKSPHSPVAGRATVLIFPDLNSGNITYKAVQRSANLISIGPMLQGMRKPVNDLSRGASVNDIIYTIALTAVQATWK